jgi:hypothetical protein
LHGGLALNDKIILKDIDAIQMLYDENEVVVVKSCLYDALFTGFICGKKHSTLLHSILHHYLDHCSNATLTISGLLYDHASSFILLTEKIINNVSFLYNRNETDIIAEHHYTKLFPLQLQDQFQSATTRESKQDLTKLKIGITIDVPETLSSFYSNGIRQNASYRV